ncbi:MAG: oligoendopeptidase F [Phycisphaerae bacterium]|nr:MAG: oligoendopeptidase F [Planctomycetia bacterium]GJQ26364.1 MAG: oligoendopeptidase F [Phycisphaerae bacterium]
MPNKLSYPRAAHRAPAAEAGTPKPAPTRDQIDARYKWDLSDIFPDDAAFEAAFKSVESDLASFTRRRGTLARSANDLRDALAAHDELGAQLERVVLYAGLSYHLDMSVGAAQGRWDRTHTLSTRAAEATSWMTPELIAVGREKINAWMASDPKLAVYRHLVDDLFRQQAHVLSEREEELLAMAGEIASAPESIFSRFTNTNLDFPVIRDEQNAEVRLTPARYGSMLYSPDRRVRRDAFIGLHETYRAKINTLSATLSAQVKQHMFYARARRFGSCLEAALHRPNIPVAVYDNLISTIERHLDKLHRYVALRKKLLQLDAVHGYDLYVPMVDAPREEIPYDDAMETVTKSLAVLGDDYTAVLREAAANRWIDVYETKDKRSGAYSWGSYLTHPYLLLNYQGTRNDRSTLAHELGHAMHSWYTVKSQPIVYGDYATFCAEVASTVNEVILDEYLYEHARSDTERLAVVQDQIESIRTTVLRQTMFAEYERRIHARAEAGEPLTGDWLCAAYRELVAKYYGPALVIDDCLEVEGLRIPHFYRNFYVYTYATSHCAAVDIGRRIVAGDAAAVRGHKAFLSAGSSRYPLDVLALAGVDMTTPAPIERTMEWFGELLGKFESLAR